MDLNFKCPEAQVYTFMLSLSFLRTQTRCPQTVKQQKRISARVARNRHCESEEGCKRQIYCG